MAAIGKDPAFLYSALDPAVSVEGERRRGRRDRSPIAVSPPSDTVSAATLAPLLEGNGLARIVHGLAQSVVPGREITRTTGFFMNDDRNTPRDLPGKE